MPHKRGSNSWVVGCYLKLWPFKWKLNKYWAALFCKIVCSALKEKELSCRWNPIWLKSVNGFISCFSVLLLSVELFSCTRYFCFCVCEWNPKVLAIKGKLLSSAFLWCCLLCCMVFINLILWMLPLNVTFKWKLQSSTFLCYCLTCERT